MTANVYYYFNNEYTLYAEDKNIKSEEYAVDLAEEAMNAYDPEFKMELDYDTELEADGETLAVIVKEVA